MRKKLSLKPKFDKAALLFAAIYSKQYRDQPIVIKIGGEVLDYPDPKVLDDILTQAVILRIFGAKVIIAHGGGKQVDRALAEKGFEQSIRASDGDRIYTKEELDVASEEAEKLSDMIVQRINEISSHLEVDTGIRGYSMHSREFITADRKITGKNTGVYNLEKIAVSGNAKASQRNSRDYVDVDEVNEVLSNPNKIMVCNWIVSEGKVGQLALNADGKVSKLAANADGIAGILAAALEAKRLMFFSTDEKQEILGIHDKDMRLIAAITPKGIDQLLEDGTLQGGMIPKSKICKFAIESGVEGVVILNPTIEDNIVNELLLSVEGTGTLARIPENDSTPDIEYAKDFQIV